MQFANIQRNSDNLMMLESMSLLNCKLKDYCSKVAQSESFQNTSDRDDFESTIRDSYEHLKEFFDVFVPKTLEEARLGSLDAVKFNEALRHIDCVQNPKAYVSRLRKTTPVKNDPYISDILDYIFVDMSGDRSHITLCRDHSDHKILTDLSKGDCLYDPTRALFNITGRLNDVGLATTVIRAGRNLVKEAYSDAAPHPSAMALFKGNVGEYLFKVLLEKLNIQCLSPSKVMDFIGCRTYELFDEYVVVDNELLCIDVKNWTSTFDKEDMAKKSHHKALGKIDTVIAGTGSRFNAVRFVYLNTRLEYNELNTKAETNKDADLYYLNLFKFYEGYPDGRLKKRLDINDKLLQLLTMEDV